MSYIRNIASITSFSREYIKRNKLFKSYLEENGLDYDAVKIETNREHSSTVNHFGDSPLRISIRVGNDNKEHGIAACQIQEFPGNCGILVAFSLSPMVNPKILIYKDLITLLKEVALRYSYTILMITDVNFANVDAKPKKDIFAEEKSETICQFYSRRTLHDNFIDIFHL